MRARPHSAEEARFLSAVVAGQGIQVSYDDLEHAPGVLLAGLEPEEESPIVLPAAAQGRTAGRADVFSIAPFATRGLAKMSGVLLATAPGEEARALTRLATRLAPVPVLPGPGGGPRGPGVAGRDAGAGRPGRDHPGRRAAGRGAGRAVGCGPAGRDAAGARLAWIPRRAGERGAVEAGALPGLLPVGRPVTDPDARAEVARAWGVASLPAEPGRDTSAILAAAAAGELGALVVAGVDPADLPDPAAALAALDATPFIVSLEIRVSAVTDRADVVFPVAAVSEKSRHVRQLGRPRRHVRPKSLPVPGDPHRAARAGRGRRRDGRAPRPA